jgi:hypothetical protein
MCAVRRADMDIRSANTPYVKEKVFLWLLSLHSKESDSLAQRVEALTSDVKDQRQIAVFQLSLK